MKRLLSLSFALAGCGGVLTRIPSPQPSEVPPSIERLVDLGSQPIAEGPLDEGAQDERFTPSEWVAIVGHGLHGAELALDGAPLAVGGYLEGGSVLVRLPGSLAPKEHRLTAKSGAGQAEATFSSMMYLIGSDTDGNAIRFLRVGAGQTKKDRVDDPKLSVKQAHTLYHALSTDGSILYGLGLNEKKGADSFIAELTMIDMGAADVPSWLGSITFSMASHPTGVAVTPQGILLVLGNQELLLFSLADPKVPAPIGKLQLSTDPIDRFLEMTLIQGGKTVCLLEVNDNRVVAISLADPAKPRAVAELELGPGTDLPFSVDLVSDPTDPDVVFVLQGLNLRLGGKKLEEGKSAVTSLVESAYDLVSGKKEDEKKQAPAVDVPKRGKLVGLRLRDRVLERTTELPTPEDFIPLFAVAAPDGKFYVSGVAPGVLETSSLDASVDSAGRILGFVKDSVQMGKIAAIDRQGAAKIAVQGVAVFFDVDLMPDGEFIYSGMRISGKVLPPFLAVKWGVGLGGSGFFGLHEVDYGYVVPPYTYGQVSAQRGQ